MLAGGATRGGRGGRTKNGVRRVTREGREGGGELARGGRRLHQGATPAALLQQRWAPAPCLRRNTQLAAAPAPSALRCAALRRQAAGAAQFHRFAFFLAALAGSAAVLNDCGAGWGGVVVVVCGGGAREGAQLWRSAGGRAGGRMGGMAVSLHAGHSAVLPSQRQKPTPCHLLPASTLPAPTAHTWGRTRTTSPPSPLPLPSCPLLSQPCSSCSWPGGWAGGGRQGRAGMCLLRACVQQQGGKLAQGGGGAHPPLRPSLSCLPAKTCRASFCRQPANSQQPAASSYSPPARPHLDSALHNLLLLLLLLRHLLSLLLVLLQEQLQVVGHEGRRGGGCGGKVNEG